MHYTVKTFLHFLLMNIFYSCFLMSAWLFQLLQLCPSFACFFLFVAIRVSYFQFLFCLWHHYLFNIFTFSLIFIPYFYLPISILLNILAPFIISFLLPTFFFFPMPQLSTLLFHAIIFLSPHFPLLLPLTPFYHNILSPISQPCFFASIPPFIFTLCHFSSHLPLSLPFFPFPHHHSHFSLHHPLSHNFPFWLNIVSCISPPLSLPSVPPFPPPSSTPASLTTFSLTQVTAGWTPKPSCWQCTRTTPTLNSWSNATTLEGLQGEGIHRGSSLCSFLL